MKIVTPGGAVVACLRSLDQTSDESNLEAPEPVRFAAGARSFPAADGVLLASLQRLARVISSGQSSEAIVRDLGHELSRLIANESYSVLMFDAERGGFSWFHGLGLQEHPIDFIPDGEGITSAVFHAGQPELVNYATSDPRYWPPRDAASDAKPEHLMLAPLVNEGNAVGLMLAGRFGDIPFTQADFDFFLVVAEMTAGVLRSAQTLEALATERDAAIRSVASMERLLESHRVIASAPAFGDLVHMLVNELRAAVPCRKLALLKVVGAGPAEVFWSDEAGRVTLLADDSSLLHYPIVERALATGEIQLVNDLDPLVPGIGGARSIVEPEHLLVVPIQLGHDHLGAIAMTRIGDHRFDLLEANVVRSLTLHAVVKSRNLVLLETTRESERREIRSRERVEAILATTRAIASWHDLPQVINAVADLLQRQITHDRFLALAIDESGDASIRHLRHAGQQLRIEHSFHLNDSPIASALKPGALNVHASGLISVLGLDRSGFQRRTRPGGTLVYTIESPDRIVGAVLIERSTGMQFTEEEQGVFEALAGLLAVAYQTASFFDEERRGRTNADLLAEAGARLSEVSSLQDLTNVIAEIIPQTIGSRSSRCVIVDETGLSVVARSSGGIMPFAPDPVSAEAGDAIALALASVTTVRDQVIGFAQLGELIGSDSLVKQMADRIALPIHHEGRFRGVILTSGETANCSQGGEASPMCAAVMDLVRTALSRALIHAEAEQRILELNAISQLNQLAASAGTETAEFCRTGATIAIEIAGACCAAIALGERPETRTIVQVGEPSAIDCSWIEPHWSTARFSRAPFEAVSPATGPKGDPHHLVVPIFADEGLLGLMVISKTDGRFVQRDVEAISRIAEQMAVGLQRVTTLELAISQRSRADRQSETLSRVLDATSLFVTIHDREELVREAVEITADLVACARIAIVWNDQDGQTGGLAERNWPLSASPDSNWERWFLDDAVLTGVARRFSNLTSDPRLVFAPGDAAEASDLGMHVLVTPLGGDDAGAGAIAYTRIGGSPFDDDEFAALRIYAAQLSAALASTRLIGRNRELLVSGIRALVSAVDAKDSYTRGHSERVSRLARIIATEMELSPQEIDTIELAGLLHDFGKIGVPDAILHKPGKLTAAERVIMMRHAGLGADMLAGAESEAMAPLVPLVRHHHEWVNGGGYPDGLIGDQIPLGSAIISVADAYDTMTTDRPYRERISHRQAMSEIYRSMGRQFSAPVVEAFESLAKSGSIPRLHGPEIEAAGNVARLPLAVDQTRPIEDARALRLLLDMIPMTHLIADSEVFYQQVTDLVRRSLDLPQISLHLTDDIGGGLVRIACSGVTCTVGPRQQPLAVGIRGAAMRSRQFRIVGDVRIDPAYDRSYDPPSGSMLLTPLIVDETVIGLLTAESDEVEALDPTNQPVLQVVADQLVSAIRLAQLHAEARKAAVTDPLTGLGNHRAFWTELDLAITAGDPFTVVMMDVEGLKRINDSFGHLAGDALLQRVAGSLREATSDRDLAARLGGDEFAIVLSNGNATQAGTIADQVRRSLLRETDDLSGRATIRYGVASFPVDGDRARDLVAVADSRLYAMMNQPNPLRDPHLESRFDA
jgi:diguanylate cyclase (GGDEF)-like protein